MTLLGGPVRMRLGVLVLLQMGAPVARRIVLLLVLTDC